MSLPFLTMCLTAVDTVFVPIALLRKHLGDSKLFDYFAYKSGGFSFLGMRPNQKEREFFEKNPIDSLRGALTATGALLRAEREYPNSLQDGEGDAMRHCYWSSRLSRDLDEASAEEILENHEWSNPDPKGYDSHNNNVGRSLGLDSSLSNDELWEMCRAKAADGTLRYDGSPGSDDDSDDDGGDDDGGDDDGGDDDGGDDDGGDDDDDDGS